MAKESPTEFHPAIFASWYLNVFKRGRVTIAAENVSKAANVLIAKAENVKATSNVPSMLEKNPLTNLEPWPITRRLRRADSGLSEDAAWELRSPLESWDWEDVEAEKFKLYR